MREIIRQIRDGASPTIDDCVEMLGDDLELLRQFRDTPQDPEWHAEGDVHIHTGMVLDEAYALLEGPAAHLEGEARLAVVLGALLHDIAKPMCTRQEELRGVVRTVARGHEAAGRSYLAPRLIEAGLSYSLLESVLGAVGYHHEPKFLVVKGKHAGAYQRVSRLTDPELLYWVELADMRGRFCVDHANGVEQIEMYRMFAEEYGAFTRRGASFDEWRGRIADTHSDASPETKDLAVAAALRELERGEISSVEEGIARSFRHRQGFPEVVITVGPSGSGKSTFIDRRLDGYDVISLDDLREEMGRDRSDQRANDRVLVEARERLKESLRKKRRVVWDATSLRKDFRTRVASLAFDYGALVTLVVFHLDLATYAARNRGRAHAVEPAVLRQQIERMEWPELDEAHRVVFVDDRHRLLGAYGFEFGESSPFALERAEGASC